MSVLLSTQGSAYFQKEILGFVVQQFLTAIRSQFPYRSSRRVIKDNSQSSCIEKMSHLSSPAPTPSAHIVNLNTASAPTSRLFKRENDWKQVCYPLWMCYHNLVLEIQKLLIGQVLDNKNSYLLGTKESKKLVYHPWWSRKCLIGIRRGAVTWSIL